MIFSELTDMEVAVLGRETYDKQHWSAEDVVTLRACWDDFQRRGEDTMMFCRPAYSDVQAFHEIDTGKVSEDDVLLLERAGAGIAPDYREVVRKLRAVEAIKEQVNTPGIQLRPIRNRSQSPQPRRSPLFTDTHLHKTTLKS